MTAKPLTTLVKKDMLWVWGEEETEAMQVLINAAVFARCLMPIGYLCECDILAEVDSSYIGVGWEWTRRTVRYPQGSVRSPGILAKCDIRSVLITAQTPALCL